jgi:fibronectin type 3 domain-containing protein
MGAVLLTPNHYTGVLTEMGLLQALGAKAVTMSVDFPILDPGFDAYGGQSANYLAFYRQVVSDIRAHGMKVIIETACVWSDPTYSSLNVMPYYNSLSTTKYDAGRANQALLIAQQLQPDYLSVIQEPDTEAIQTGKSELGTVSGSTALLNQILSVYRQPGATLVPVGAGVGTWITSYDQFIQNFVATSIDFVDTHIYPVNLDYLTRAITIASMASTAGKKIAMTECWLQKVRDSELTTLTQDTILARNNFSFWAPLDTQFLQAMVDFSYYENLLFATPFWEEYFFGYVDYNTTTAAMTPAALNAAAVAAQTPNMLIGAYSTTGHNWETSILPGPDTTPPSSPVLTTSGVYPNSVNVVWAATADNVGTAGYRFYRNGELLTTTTYLNYYDTGLSDGKVYTYTATAFDASGNVSSPSAPLAVTTPDITPPSTPANFKVMLVSPTQINLSWSASTDNVGVKQYAIYRGKGGAAPTGYAITPGTTFSNTSLQSAYTYCYYVAAQDAAMNTSPPTPTLCASTPDTIPPSPPTNVTAVAVSGTQVRLSWTASTDNVGVTGYQVQRIQGATTKTIGTSASTSYLDSTASPNTTYYYTISAYDAAGNHSYPSAVKITTP